MVLLERYRTLAPFTIDELVEAANSVLRDQPRLQITKRTVRYYITEGIISSPQGAPKYARYPFESLLRIVGARCLLEQGMTLERSRTMLDEWSKRTLSEVEGQVAGLLNQPSDAILSPIQAPSFAPQAIEENPYEEADQTVRRIRLEPDLVLEASGAISRTDALRRAIRAIQRTLGTFSDTT